jgi:beta-lactam-binding protein with PASTA domain
MKIASLSITPTIATVPNVIGRTAVQAQADIEAAGLVSDGSIVFAFGRPLHRVYSQNILPGTTVAYGSVVKWKANP